MIWDRERYVAHCRHEFTGREMFCELFGPLQALEDEWRAQGAAPGEIEMTAFDWDYVRHTWLSGNCGAVTGRSTAPTTASMISQRRSRRIRRAHSISSSLMS